MHNIFHILVKKYIVHVQFSKIQSLLYPLAFKFNCIFLLTLPQPPLSILSHALAKKKIQACIIFFLGGGGGGASEFCVTCPLGLWWKKKTSH